MSSHRVEHLNGIVSFLNGAHGNETKSTTLARLRRGGFLHRPWPPEVAPPSSDSPSLGRRPPHPRPPAHPLPPQPPRRRPPPLPHLLRGREITGRSLYVKLYLFIYFI
jgi:hypothetical protein